MSKSSDDLHDLAGFIGCATLVVLIGLVFIADMVWFAQDVQYQAVIREKHFTAKNIRTSERYTIIVQKQNGAFEAINVKPEAYFAFSHEDRVTVSKRIGKFGTYTTVIRKIENE